MHLKKELYTRIYRSKSIFHKGPFQLYNEKGDHFLHSFIYLEFLGSNTQKLECADKFLVVDTSVLIGV